MSPGRDPTSRTAEQHARHERRPVVGVVPDGQRLPRRCRAAPPGGRPARGPAPSARARRRRRRRGRRPARSRWRPASARGRRPGARPATSSAVRRAVPLGASALSGWCSSTISTDSKNRAACAANRIISTAPTAKFGATRTPTPGASASQPRSVASRSSSKPVVPTTDVDAVLDAELQVVHDGVRPGEVDRDLGAGVGQRRSAGRPSRAARPARGRRRPRRRGTPRSPSGRADPEHADARRSRSGHGARVKSRSSSNGPTTARVGVADSTSAATSGTSSRVTASIRRQHLVDGEQLAVDQLGLADPAHPRAGVLQAEHQRPAQLALAALELLGGDARRRRPCPARRGRWPAPRRPCAGTQPA